MIARLVNQNVISSTGSRQQLNFKRQRTKSTESKTSNDSEGVSDDVLSADDVAGLSIDILKSRAMQKRRDSSGTGTARRGSESGPGMFCFSTFAFFNF